MTISTQTQSDLRTIVKTLDQRIHELASESSAGAELVSLNALRAGTAALIERR